MVLSESEREAFQDIRDNIDRALRFVDGLDFDAFCADEKTFYAVARCTEIVEEAVGERLPPGFALPKIWKYDESPFWGVAHFTFHRLEHAAGLWRVIHELFPSLR